jgi:predicted dehydrogenase
MRFAILGTGFVADYYLKTLSNYDQHSIAGVFDVDGARLEQFSAHHNLKTYKSEAELLSDETVDAVAVLTGPKQHFDLASSALAAGKHVYCEKPMAMTLDDARNLVAQAQKADLVVVSAPANTYSDAFKLAQATISNAEIGVPKLVYAEMEDGAVFREQWQHWRSESGAPWPGKDEFEIGCTLEHAGYSLSWLIGLFGTITRITGASASLFKDKGVEIAGADMAPDFSTAVIEFESGVIARLTCGLCAPKDRSMTIMATKGSLTIADLWDHRSDLFVETDNETLSILARVARRLEAIRGKFLAVKPRTGRKLRYRSAVSTKHLPKYPSQIDFFAGLNALAECVDGGAKNRAQFAAEALHITEAALALSALGPKGSSYEMTSSL